MCHTHCGRLSLTTSAGPQVSVYDFPSLKRLAKLDTTLKGVRHLALSGAEGKSNRRMLCINGRNGSCTVWAMTNDDKDVITVKQIKSLTVPDAAGAKADFRGCSFFNGSTSLITGLWPFYLTAVPS